jgi:hypothetical protein
MFLAMQATQPANAAAVSVTFDTGGETYVTEDAGATPTVMAPPVAQPGGSSNALRIVLNGRYTGTIVENYNGFELISASSTTVTAKVYSGAIGTPFRLKLEAGAGAQRVEKDYLTTTTGWETATWDFSTGLPAAWDGSGVNPQVLDHTLNYKKAIIFPNFDLGTSGTYYVDDIAFNKAVTCSIASTAVLASMDSNDNAGLTPSGFGGTTSEVTTAPAGGSQGNKNALKIVKGWETWAGITILDNACMNYGVGGSATANVYAPAAGLPMMLKLDGPNAFWDGDDVERTATTWRAGWQQLKWDFTGVTGTHSKVSLFPNFNVADNGRVFYLDDLALNGATSPMWGNNLPNIPFSTVSDETNGKYVHVRLQKSFVTPSFDASWWDGIREYRDADTKAYVKYLAARSTFSLVYKVTDANGAPMPNTPVELIVNTNYSCSKATFTYGVTVIGKDDCAGKGETRLPKKNTDANGEVTFVLTNTNVKGEAMPASLSSAPTVGVANEIGTNIQPHVADKEGIDMLLAHFVEPSGGVTLSGAASAEMTVDTKTPVTFKLKDAAGKAIAGVDVKFISNGVGTVGRTATTDSDGNVSTWVNNIGDVTGVQTVSATYAGSGFPASASTVIQWTSTKPVATVTGGKGSVTVSIANGSGKTARISVAGSATVSRKLSSNSAVVKVKASAGAKVVTVTIDGVATKVVVQVAK